VPRRPGGPALKDSGTAYSVDRLAITIFDQGLRTLFFLSDDATVVAGTNLAQVDSMSAKSLAARVAALEAKVGSKSIQEQFREQAELIDRLFTYRFDEYDKKIDLKLAALEDRLEAKLETKLESKLEPIRTDLKFLKDTVTVILDRLT
jgi:hypothetical protein